MKKLMVLSSLCILLTGNMAAQKSKLVGSWLITEVQVGTEVQNPYQITDYNEDGSFVVMGIEAGTWQYNKVSNSIVMQSELDKDFNGEAKIINLTNKELILSKDGVKMFYTKVNKAEIIENNKNSGLIGTWEFNDVPYPDAKIVVTFTEPDAYTMIQKEEGMTGTFKGTWIFNSQDKSLIMIGLRREDTFNGENKVLNISEESLELENNGTVFKGIKKAERTEKIERLTFSEDDFYEENGASKYNDDEQKLPWQDAHKMMIYLEQVHQLVYNFSTLLSDTNSFETKTLTANIRAIAEESILTIDNVFNGYDSYTLSDDEEMPSNDYESYNKLYPLEDFSFRVAGNEEITVPAGTFNCTVIEGVHGFDENMKVWMINDKPGIIAKVIRDNPDEDFGHYFLFELQEIK